MFRRLLACVLLLLALAGCGASNDTAAVLPTATSAPTATIAPSPTPTCIQQAKPFVTAMDGLLSEWSDALKLADQTARMSLVGPVSQLQEIKRKAGALVAPDCAKTAQQRAADYFDAQVNVYLGFMAQEGTYNLGLDQQSVENKHKVFLDAYAALKP